MAITADANTSRMSHRSPRSGTAAKAPTTGAVAKNPASRAAPQQAKSLHVEDETDPVAEEAEQERRNNDHGRRPVLPRKKRNAGCRCPHPGL
jgi:hypothetical protein